MEFNGIKRCLTMLDKKKILKEIDERMKKTKLTTRELAMEMNLPRSTILTIIKKRESIEGVEPSEQHRCRAVRKQNPIKRKSIYDELEIELKNWMKSTGSGLKSGRKIREQSKIIAKSWHLDNFTASNGWYDRFRKKLKDEEKVKILTPINCNHILSMGTAENIKAEDYLDYITDSMEESNKSYTIKSIEEHLLIWHSLALKCGAKMSGSLLKRMALTLSGYLDIVNFTASHSWLDKYKKRRASLCSKCVMGKRDNLP